MVLLNRRILFFLVTVFLLICMHSSAALASILVRDGSRGDSVRHVQNLLIDQGYLDGGVDGICGPKTVAAIRSFQQSNGLTADGICGDATYRVLSGGRSYEPETPCGAAGRVLYVSATAYSAQDPGNSCYTAAGTLVRRGVIAVDPEVIPMGTRVYIPGYGEAVAEDTGGAIRGHHIDVAFDTHGEALAFGRRNIEVYILE